MKQKEIKDFCNPLYKTFYLFNLIDQHIYFVSGWDKIVKLKVCSISINKGSKGDVFLELTCTPVDTKGNPVGSYDDEVLDYDDLNKSWFFDYAAASRQFK